MVIEAGVVAGYVIAWALRKARRIGGRLDVEADAVIDAGMERLNELVAARLGHHPVLAELAEEAEQTGEVSDLTRQQVQLALAAVARRDDAFGQALTELVARLREAEAASGRPQSAVLTGNVHAEASSGGFAFGQVTGDVNIGREDPGPTGPGRFGH